MRAADVRIMPRASPLNGRHGQAFDDHRHHDPLERIGGHATLLRPAIAEANATADGLAAGLIGGDRGAA